MIQILSLEVMMLWEGLGLKSLVDQDGIVSEDQLEERDFLLSQAEKLMTRTLGCTIIVKGRKFILSNLELYYGSVGDRAHDWWRTNFSKARGISKEHASYQFREGPRLYLKQRGKGNQNRADLIVGPEGVAISFLIRNVWDESRKRVGESIDGNPALILREGSMDIEDSMIGEIIELLDTHSEYVPDESDIIKCRRYIGGKGYSGFDEAFKDKLWNYRIPDI